MRSNNALNRILFAFDFDFTMIDDDSDHYVFQQLSPSLFAKVHPLKSAHPNSLSHVPTSLSSLMN